MSTRLAVRILSASLMAAVAPGTSAAQPAGTAPVGWLDKVAVGGEASGSLAPPDDSSFFNYTDYEHDLLRTARLRLFGEWHLRPGLSLVAEGRLDHASGVGAAAWYVRWRPRAEWNLDVQAGRIPPVIGAFGRRAYGRDNPLAGAPLAYQYLTSLRPDALPRDVDELLGMRARGWRPRYSLGSSSTRAGVPLAASSEWDTGIEARWLHGRVELSGAVTRGSPAEPVVRETNSGLQWSGRAAFRILGGATVAMSGSLATWLDDEAHAALPPSLRDHNQQSIVAIDAEWGGGPWLLRAEWVHSRFDLPMLDEPQPRLRMAASSGFMEARFRPHPRWQIAGRAGFLGFSEVTGVERGTAPWDAPVQRLESVLSYRVTRRVELRGGWQHDWRSGGRVRKRGFPVAGVLVWF